MRARPAQYEWVNEEGSNVCYLRQRDPVTVFMESPETAETIDSTFKFSQLERRGLPIHDAGALSAVVMELAVQVRTPAELLELAYSKCPTPNMRKTLRQTHTDIKDTWEPIKRDHSPVPITLSPPDPVHIDTYASVINNRRLSPRMQLAARLLTNRIWERFGRASVY